MLTCDAGLIEPMGAERNSEMNEFQRTVQCSAILYAAHRIKEIKHLSACYVET